MIRLSLLAACAALSLTLTVPALAHGEDHPDAHHAHDHDHGADHDCNGAGVVAVGDFEFSNAFTRATMPNAPTAGGYVTIANGGAADDRLVSASSPVAGEVQIHEMAVVDEVMRMQELPDGLAIPAGERVALAPGGLHLMFLRLGEQLVEGERVPVTLVFEAAGAIEITLSVRGAAAMDAGGHGH